jgi:hypothetical protein
MVLMTIFVPKRDQSDATRNPLFYDDTYSYIKEIGMKEIF